MTFVNLDKPEMLWVDLETTGLDARLDVPLELGLALTDRWGKAIDTFKVLIREYNEDYRRGIRRGIDNEFVNEMHTKSGLWSDLDQRNQCKTRWEAENLALDWLKKNNVEEGKMPMCGNSIGSLDRPFTIEHFPGLNKFLHYRNIDISSFKEVCKLVNPDLYKNLEPIIGTKADATHRVLDDCGASIREYQAYLENFLMVP